VELLLKSGADINALDRWGSTPVKGAALFNNVKVVDYLVAKGAKGAKARNEDQGAAKLIE
jgi:ankyrin repeat protein